MVHKRRRFCGSVFGLAALTAVSCFSETALTGTSAFAATSEKAKVIDVPPEEYLHPTLYSKSKEPVGVGWIFALDISSSVENPEFRAQMDAIIETVSRDDFREQIFSGGGPGSACIMIVDFGSDSKVVMGAVDLREDDSKKIDDLVAALKTISRRSSQGSTYHTGAMKNAGIFMEALPFEVERMNLLIYTDGTGPSDNSSLEEYRGYKQSLAEQGVVISTLVTRTNFSGKTDVYDFALANMTTPPNTYKKNGSAGFLSAGVTTEVAHEVAIKGSNIARYANRVADIVYGQIRTDTSALDMYIWRYAEQSPQIITSGNHLDNG